MKEALLQQLESYIPSNEWETQCKIRMLQLLNVEYPFDRSSFPGHFTASACIIDPVRKKMLMVHHGKYDIWIQLGGHVVYQDATIEESARREAMEEAGVGDLIPSETIFDIDIHTVTARPDEQAHEHFDIRYLYFYDAETPILLSEESKALQWVNFNDVEKITKGDESIMRMLRKMN